MCYDILCDEMTYEMLSINTQPLCHVINVYINAQMIILIINVNINAIFLKLLSIMLMVLLWSGRRWVCYHVICDAMCLYDLYMEM